MIKNGTRVSVRVNVDGGFAGLDTMKVLSGTVERLIEHGCYAVLVDGDTSVTACEESELTVEEVR